MLHPVLTILVAGSFHWAAESPRQAEFAQIVHDLTLAVDPAGSEGFPGEPEPTVCDIPFYYSDFLPVAAPAAPTIITYNWRSPVIFDLP